MEVLIFKPSQLCAKALRHTTMGHFIAYLSTPPPTYAHTASAMN